MPAPGRNHLLLMPHGGYTYLLGPFRFAVDASAPLPSPYSESGAVGSLTVTDTGNKLSISAGRVRSSGLTGAGDPRLIYATGFTRRAGLALLATTKWTVDRACFGWAATATPTGSSVFGYNNIGATPSAYPANTVAVAGSIDSGTGADLLVILRGTGAYMFSRNNGSSGPYTLDWVDNADTTSPLYPGTWAKNTDFQVEADNLRVLDLGPISSLFASDYALATQRKAVSVGADTITATADALIEHTITAATGVTQELMVRRVDDSNCWIVRMDQAGSTVKLIEKVAGVETERASAAQTWTNTTTYRVVTVVEGSVVKTYVANTLKTSYASASTNSTATGVKVSTAGTDLVSWPRTVTLPGGV